VGAQWDGFRASRDRTAHGLDGDFVRPGGAVGLFPVWVVVGLPGGVVGDPTVGVLGATVVGTAVGVRRVGVLVGVLDGSLRRGAGVGSSV
jgi:hypothetical protein